MLLTGEIKEEDCDSLVWEEMEFEIASDKEGELTFAISHHLGAVKFLKTMMKVDKKLSNKSKKAIRRALSILKASILKADSIPPRAHFMTSRFDHATDLACAFTRQDSGSYMEGYI